MNEEQLEQLGVFANKCENLACAALLPMPPQFHVDQLTNALKEMSAEIKALYVEVSGENPWSDG